MLPLACRSTESNSKTSCNARQLRERVSGCRAPTVSKARRLTAHCRRRRQLLLQISLGRHAAEHGPLSGVVADLSDEDLERAYLVAAHRFHVAPVDGERDR